MEFDLSQIVIGGTALVPLVMGIVSLAKRLGMPGEYAPWLNGVLSTAGYFLSVFLTQYPQYNDVAQMVTFGVVAFLASSGTYQLSKPGVAKKK